MALSVGHGSPEQIAVNRALKAAGAVVLIRPSAAEMVQMLCTFVPTIVVTELLHDDETGTAVLHAIRRLPRNEGGDLPVLGICARVADGEPLPRTDFQGVLVDPFEPAEVARIVLRAVDATR